MFIAQCNVIEFNVSLCKFNVELNVIGLREAGVPRSAEQGGPSLGAIFESRCRSRAFCRLLHVRKLDGKSCRVKKLDKWQLFLFNVFTLQPLLSNLEDPSCEGPFRTRISRALRGSGAVSAYIGMFSSFIHTPTHQCLMGVFSITPYFCTLFMECFCSRSCNLHKNYIL